MQDLLKTIFDFVIWVLVPAILVLVIWIITSIMRRVEDEKYKTSLRGGFWGGFILFTMILIYQVGQFLRSGFPQNDIFQGFNILLALGSALVIFAILSGGKRVYAHKLSGWIVLLLTFASFYSLLHYLLMRTYNEILLSIILGIAFGVLGHIASFPSSLRQFFEAQWH